MREFRRWRLTQMKKLSKKEMWSIQEEQFPSEKHIQALIPLLKPSELRELTTILVTEVVAGCRNKDLLQVAEDVNGWVATAEEYVEFRHKRRYILKAQEDRRGDVAL